MRSWILASCLALTACQVEGRAGRVERCALGVHVDDVAALEAEIGHPFNFERTYHGWDDAFPDARERASAAQGHTILASFQGRRASGELIPFARVADPTDVAITRDLQDLAARLRDFGQPIYVIYHDEADNDGAYGSPAEFVAAWRRIVTVIRDAGADNVVWVWSLTAKAYPSQADAWYPGDAWVDRLSVSGYNWYTGDPVSPWRTFASIFASFFEWAASHPQPAMIGATSTGENPRVANDAPRSKPTWIREALSTIEATPQLQAVVWFANADGTDAHKDWRLDSSAASLDAFRAFAADSYFDVSGRTPP